MNQQTHPDIEELIRQANTIPSIVTTLGITFLSPASFEGEEGEVRATMPADDATCQPFGYLSGGAMLALQESLAGIGSVLRLPPALKPVGASVTANHVSGKAKGGLVLGRATLLHEGRSTHLWNVDVLDGESGRLISTARVLNHIIPLQH
ncbi:MAG: PaaI family thioesterase [Desulfovibrionaceae bacterium]|nr:PaaI family thioesterase [Desulfovibrionaceae bacterium]